MSKRVLVVEDEEDIRRLVLIKLKGAGYVVVTANDGEEGLAAAVRDKPDLLVSDVMMPKKDGYTMVREVREALGPEAPAIIMLTARGQDTDVATGLDSGADDYIVKPFAPRELIARVNAVLRRSGGQDETELVRIDELTLDRAGHRVMVGERTVTLGPTEYRLLEFFMTHPERVYSREQLLDRVWGGNVYVEERTIDVHIRRLRKALDDYGYDRLVQTVRGAGYRFSARPET